MIKERALGSQTGDETVVTATKLEIEEDASCAADEESNG